jgi:hypothetical protein
MDDGSGVIEVLLMPIDCACILLLLSNTIISTVAKSFNFITLELKVKNIKVD